MALQEEVGAGITVVLVFESVSIIHSFYSTNIQNLLSSKYSIRHYEGLYKQEVTNVYIHLTPLPTEELK